MVAPLSSRTQIPDLSHCSIILNVRLLSLDSEYLLQVLSPQDLLALSLFLLAGIWMMAEFFTWNNWQPTPALLCYCFLFVYFWTMRGV